MNVDLAFSDGYTRRGGERLLPRRKSEPLTLAQLSFRLN